ncbi:hypothetical protein B0H34DRAFT_673371 [Crassisporium funariophilum]|nr:hypothetical protein B0H34DRAFT_673371 [Crassisporium funariophilum]
MHSHIRNLPTLSFSLFLTLRVMLFVPIVVPVNCGTIGLANLKKRHCGTKACQSAQAKQDKKAKSRKDRTILSFLKPKVTTVPLTVSSQARVHSYKLAVTDAIHPRRYSNANEPAVRHCGSKILESPLASLPKKKQCKVPVYDAAAAPELDNGETASAILVALDAIKASPVDAPSSVSAALPTGCPVKEKPQPFPDLPDLGSASPASSGNDSLPDVASLIQLVVPRRSGGVKLPISKDRADEEESASLGVPTKKNPFINDEAGASNGLGNTLLSEDGEDKEDAASDAAASDNKPMSEKQESISDGKSVRSIHKFLLGAVTQTTSPPNTLHALLAGLTFMCYDGYINMAWMDMLDLTLEYGRIKTTDTKRLAVWIMLGLVTDCTRW